MELSKGYFKANSILESVIALSIISICLYIAVIVFSQVFSPRTSAKYYASQNRVGELFFLFEIVQYNKSYDIQTGLKAGLDKINNHQTSGVLFPESDMSLNSTSVNSLINAFNGFGLFKLGKVTSSFYLNLKLLENNSIVKVESTPKIATLSGHEAKLAIGETSYYFEQNNRLLTNSIGNDILQSGTWKSTDANLSVSIKPFVSTDENVTLNISVEKSSFLGRAGETAPPGKATQRFESLVRVKNNEMILLGGLDELRKENSGTGTPLISRIPILKWFFSSRKKGKSDSKLHIFLKPTIVY